ncbi:histidine kinase [Pseudoalteromonas sp. CO325X]|uniref:sensor histidine kinase n=1 Tax=Pseudoalteromonas sp. CO325X TaxID=1777262 RepID=UPI001022A543|nr:ATP-binding protein [Pseudoalteromonas sp. CO325X]RZF80564.1 histidine kinase [Pseudoalteromonas sp. CO325X]
MALLTSPTSRLTWQLSSWLSLFVCAPVVAGVLLGLLSVLQALLLAVVLGALQAMFIHYVVTPRVKGLQAIESGLLNFKDGDFSTSLAYNKNDELGDLCRLYNETASKLHQERQWIYQRELMLDKVLHSSPQALLLVNDKQQVVYSNHSARSLLFADLRVEGEQLSVLFARMPNGLAQALQAGKEGLFSVEQQHEQRQTWHLATGHFLLNNQAHTLYILKPMTREISRQEVQVWKKVIRVISHELNNSLAPVSSMLHSGQLLAQGIEDTRLARVFTTIDERIGKLSEFVQGYGRFAKLPQPQMKYFSWDNMMQGLTQQWAFTLLGELPEQGYGDDTQLEQLLINLLKNAHESGSPEADISVEVNCSEAQQEILVRDRGKGMSEAVMASALVPFYSTKSSGSGLGLALCREICEAHHGDISLHNRHHGGLVVRVHLPLA